MDSLEKIIKEFFLFIGDDIRVFIKKEDNVFSVDVKMKEPQILIGEKGKTLTEIEKLLKIIGRKKREEIFFINLDINDYKKRKREYLEDLAAEVAKEVSQTGVEKSFPAMSAFERRIIHKEIAEREDVETESIGSGLERRIIVRKKII